MCCFLEPFGGRTTLVSSTVRVSFEHLQQVNVLCLLLVLYVYVLLLSYGACSQKTAGQRPPRRRILPLCLDEVNLWLLDRATVSMNFKFFVDFAQSVHW